MLEHSMPRNNKIVSYICVSNTFHRILKTPNRYSTARLVSENRFECSIRNLPFSWTCLCVFPSWNRSLIWKLIWVHIKGTELLLELTQNWELLSKVCAAILSHKYRIVCFQSFQSNCNTLDSFNWNLLCEKILLSR